MAQNPFPELVKKYMTRTGLTDTTLSEKLRVKRETVYRWRTGGIKSPQCERMMECAKIFQLNPLETYEFLTAAGCPNPGAYPTTLIQSPPAKGPFSAQNGLVPVPLVPASITRPISHPAQFFGHQILLEQRIFKAWQQIPLEHVVITGPKQSGKSSLLNYVKMIHQYDEPALRQGQKTPNFSKNYSWVLIDFENVQFHRPENLLRFLLKELGFSYHENNDLIDLTERLNEQLQQPTVILMDNIESGLCSPELDDRFWGYLRYLGNHANGQVGFGVASRYPLVELEKLADEQRKPSPLANVFSEIELGPLKEEEARELLSYVSILPAEEEWILQHSQGWPLLLQALCQIRLDYEGRPDWQTVGLEKIKYYGYLWQTTTK